MSSSHSVGRVYLVGAGPGDPGLLTLRGAECLAIADLVIFDRLVNRRLLDLAPRAEHLCVTDLPGTHPERAPQVNDLLVRAAQEGRVVVRLKGGDPLVFGRGGEEAEVLRAAGIPYEIVPGVTAALGAAACAGIPLTHRRLSSAVALVAGHESSDKEEPGLDWAALARFPGTLVIYMGQRRLDVIAQELIGHGLSPQTPAAAVQWATTGRQNTVEATLATLAERVRDAAVEAPMVTLIGPVVELRLELAWFERRPLFGRRVLVTRPRRQAEKMVRQLEILGATVHFLPTVEIGPPPDVAAVDRAIDRLSEFQWLVFTSANGVGAFLDRLLARGRDLRALGLIRIAAIGPRTAEALGAYHLRPDLVPAEYRSEALIEALRPDVAGQRVLLARADRGRELLAAELGRIATVEQVAVYTQRDRPEADPEIMDLLRQGAIDFVTLTSPNIARAFLQLLDDPSRGRLGTDVRLVTISPVTTDEVLRLGAPVSAEATEFTGEGVVAAICHLARAP